MPSLKRKTAEPDSDAESSQSPPPKRVKESKKSPRERDSEFLAKFASKHDDVDLEDDEDVVNAAVLATQLRDWKKNQTECYEHYKDPVLVKEKGVWKYQFVCKRYPSKAIVRARYDKATTNLVNHARNCDPSAGNSIKKFTKGGDYNVGCFRTNLALWVAVRNRPHLAVTDKELVDAFKTLQPNVEVPSNDTVGRDVKRIAELTRPTIIELFKKHDGVLHGMLDGWTAANVLSSVGLGVQWVSENTLRTLLIDMIPLNKSHTGRNLGDVVFAAFKEFGIERKVCMLSLSLDLRLIFSVGAGDPTDSGLDEVLDAHSARINLATRIRCLAHILNLIVKAFLSLFVPRKGEVGDDDENEDEYDTTEDEEYLQALEDVDESVEASDAAAIEELDEDELLNARDLDIFLSEEERKMARDAYRKLMRLGHRIFNSATLRQQLAEIATNLNLSNAEKKCMIRAVLTRWNSVTDVIVRGLELQPALDRLCATSKGRSSIKSLLLSNDEWQLMYQVKNVLLPFKEATLRVSTNKYPRLSEVIPIIDLLNNHLESVVRQTESDVFVHTNPKSAKKSTRTSPTRRPMFTVVRVAAVLALGICDKYYSKTDDSIMYRGAMRRSISPPVDSFADVLWPVLDPRYRVAHLRKIGWDPDWIKQAIELMRTQWRTFYRVETMSHPSQTPTESSSIFAELDDDPITSDPFEHFINDTPISKSNCRGTMSPYATPAARKSPNNVALIRMAQDFLGAPATSVDIERAFSHAGGMVTKRRHALSSETIRANALVAAWSKADLIPRKEVEAALGSLKSRKPKVISVDSDHSGSDDGE
uniref:HAT C-terminal dimerisation domain-containing protein n=1 Tax=Mycena chlorophos TaxID=658473 RepID=A0ABQ0L0I0_MYCCL|nr:predicted protein [Mycena chlorophos]